MTNQNLYIDIHAIQTVPPSNINRDDTGSPKTAQYGGVTRARVSSQSWKKAIRNYFKENEVQLGIRSKEFVVEIANKIKELDTSKKDDEALKLAEDTLTLALKKDTQTKAPIEKGKLRALLFLTKTQVEKIAEAAIEGKKDKKSLKRILNEEHTLDISLFGRMVASDPLLNEDASAQVAHAISTHAVQTEFDYYTAVDDLAPEDNAGAGMLGTIEFNSSTLYRYANVAAHELVRQLVDKEAVVSALQLFIEAFSNSMPTGKVNTFANQTLPQALIVIVRRDRPVNLVSAFENPVKSNKGFVEGSLEQLATEFQKVQKYVDVPEFALTIGVQALGEEQENLKGLLSNFARKLIPLLTGE